MDNSQPILFLKRAFPPKKVLVTLLIGLLLRDSESSSVNLSPICQNSNSWSTYWVLRDINAQQEFQAEG